MKTKDFFKDIRVTDLSWMGVGSTISKYLAEYGAQIIKVESRTRPDPMRSLPPFKDDRPNLDGSHLWADLNINKYSVAINLSKPKGTELARRIVACSDVVVESFSPGSVERMGLGYEDLKKVKPDIIMVSAGMQGRGGPHSATRGTGATLSSLAGFTNITGWPDRTPSGTNTPYTDFVAPLFGAAALHAAIDYRQRTGKGQYLDLSQFEACIHFLAPLVLDSNVNKRVTQRAGNTSAYAAPHGVYRCSEADRWCAIAVHTDAQWMSLCQVIGKPQLVHDRRFATLSRRLKNREELDKIIETWTIEHSPDEVMITLQSKRVPAGIVENATDMWNDPQLRFYPAYCELDHPVMGRHVGLRRGIELSKMQFNMRRSPLLSEHNEYVCKQVLGMGEEEFTQLVSEGVLEFE